MRRYLATLHTKPAHHKKRFALLVSGGFTLLIFSIWTLVTFGTGGTLAQNPSTSLGTSNQREVSPLESLKAGAAESFEGIRENLKALINIYGRPH